MTSSSDSQGRQYPMLESCRITVVRPRSGGGQSGNDDLPPVRLPQDCIDSYNDLMQNKNTIPKPYDFALGTYKYLTKSSEERRIKYL